MRKRLAANLERSSGSAALINIKRPLSPLCAPASHVLSILHFLAASAYPVLEVVVAPTSGAAHAIVRSFHASCLMMLFWLGTTATIRCADLPSKVTVTS